MTAYLEITLSWLFANAKGRDKKAFTTLAPFANCPSPSISITSPDCGANGATLGPDYMNGGKDGGRFPELEWEGVDGVKQWLLVSEDPDAPLPTPICHGIYLGIPHDKKSVTNADFKPEEGSSSRLKGGFSYGMSRNGSIYILPRPLMNHGIHRYFFDIIALNEPLDSTLVASKPTREQVAKAIEGKVISWGRWTGECQRVWK